MEEKKYKKKKKKKEKKREERERREEKERGRGGGGGGGGVHPKHITKQVTRLFSSFCCLFVIHLHPMPWLKLM